MNQPLEAHSEYVITWPTTVFPSRSHSQQDDDTIKGGSPVPPEERGNHSIVKDPNSPQPVGQNAVRSDKDISRAEIRVHRHFMSMCT